MVPFGVLVVSWLVLRALGALGIGVFVSWQADAAYALALMFVVTASVHFTRSKADLIAMVPRQLRFPEQIVTITGVCEALGAIGLLIPATRLAAGVCLILLLVAMLPANISGARRHIALRGRPPMSLWLRVPLQLVFIGVTAFAIFA